MVQLEMIGKAMYTVRNYFIPVFISAVCAVLRGRDVMVTQHGKSVLDGCTSEQVVVAFQAGHLVLYVDLCHGDAL